MTYPKFWTTALLGLSIIAMPSLSFGHDLLDTYNLAIENDPNLRASESVRNAGLESTPKAIGSMLPAISGNYSTTRTDSGITGLPDRNVSQIGLSLTQPVYQHDLWAGLKLANQQVKQAEATYVAAQQNLIIRVATQYFAVLDAEDTLKFTTQQRIAFQKQLDQTRQRFDVGLIAITDVHEATARRDGAVADELGAKNVLADEYEKLQEITKIHIDKVSALSDKVVLVSPKPNNIEDWVTTAGRQNYALKAAYYAKKVARTEILRQNTGHMPNLQFQGTLKRGGSTLANGDFINKQAILQANFPLYAGGGTQAKVREATANYHRAQHLHDAQLRATLSNTKQAFRGVLTQISQVEALKQAVKSNQSALDATEAAYEVGTRTIVDVLNAQTNLLSAERQHSQARNKYIVELLKLKEASGTLSPEDIKIVNNWLQSRNEHAIYKKEEASKKKSQTEKKQDEATKPNDTAKLKEEATKKEDETTKPKEDITKKEDKEAKTTKSKEELTKNESNTAKQVDNVSKKEDEASKPKENIKKTEDNSEKKDETVAKKEDNTSAQKEEVTKKKDEVKKKKNKKHKKHEKEAKKTDKQHAREPKEKKKGTKKD